MDIAHLLVHSVTEGHLSCFYFLSVMNKAAINNSIFCVIIEYLHIFIEETCIQILCQILVGLFDCYCSALSAFYVF
jgi:hypothetical protein